MRKHSKLLTMLCVVIFAFVACDNNDVPPVDNPTDKPVVTLAQDEVAVPVSGGDFSVDYTIANATEEATLTVDNEAQWITDVTVDAQQIRFLVEANSGDEERVATLKVNYPQAEERVITVKQAGAASPTDGAFMIDVQEVHATSAITQVTPAEGEMLYVMYLEEVSYLVDNEIDTAEKLWEDDFRAFDLGAANRNMNLKEYMESANILFSGTKRVRWDSVLPGIKSVLYVYGVRFSEDGASYEPVTDISWAIIEPEYAPLQDISFDIDVAVSGANATLSVKPVEWDGYYLVKVVDVNNELYPNDASAFTDDYMKILADEWIDVYDDYLSSGFSSEDILSEICSKGESSIDVALNSYALYSVLVFPVAEYDGLMQVVAKPSYENFSTEEVKPSDMTIDIDITNCHVRVADLRVTPSNLDEDYILMVTPTEYLPESYDDDSLVEWMFTDMVYYLQIYNGEITSHMNTLHPETEYLVIALGYSGGVVTTKPFTKSFKTQPEGECEVHITNVTIGGPYRPSDLYNYDPERFRYYIPPYCYDTSFFVLTVEVTTDVPASDIFILDYSVMDFEYRGEEGVFSDLLMTSRDGMHFFQCLYEYNPYYILAAAFDSKGNVTPMWRSEEMTYTEGDLKPIDDLIEKLEASPNTMLLGVSADGRVVPIVR